MSRFPDSPFWDYSLRLYSAPGVADSCIALQDEYGLDVNMLLFCAWCATEGAGRLDGADIGQALARTRDWQARVVQPLRAVRRYCSRDDSEPGDTLRETMKLAVQTVELDAEHVEQLILTRLVDGRRSETSPPAEAAANLVHNLRLYLSSQQVELTAPVAGYLLAVMAAALPSMPGDAIARMLSA